MKRVIIFRGISGAGKTTLAQRLMDPFPGLRARISTDDFWIGDDGIYRFDVTRLNEAHIDCFKRFSRCISKDDPYELVLLDNTNTSVYEFAPYVMAALAAEASLRIITVVCDPMEAAKSNRHNTPQEVIWRQHQNLTKSETEMPGHWRKYCRVAFRHFAIPGGFNFQDPIEFIAEMARQHINKE